MRPLRERATARDLRVRAAALDAAAAHVEAAQQIGRTAGQAVGELRAMALEARSAAARRETRKGRWAT